MTDNEYTMQGARYRSAYNRSGVKLGRPTPATLDEAGESVLQTAIAAINKFDPDGTALKFSFITDLHRSENAYYAGNANIDDRPSMRLLSRLCDEVDIDAVFCGGDTVNGRSENVQYVAKNMQDVAADLDDLLPYTNVFATIGNHDKRYSSTSVLNTNKWLYDLYDHLQQNGNGVELHYIDDTNFYVDFTKHKVRIIFMNQYDDVDSNSSWYANESTSFGTGIPTHGTTAWTAALNIDDKENWLVGVVYHGADTGVAGTTDPDSISTVFPILIDTLQAYVDNGGKGVIGVFAGHYHTAHSYTVLPHLNVVHVSNAYAQESQIGSNAAYCFSVIVLDSETGLFHEIRVGRDATEIPFCAYFGSNNGGLLQNGTHKNGVATALIYGGNHVRFDRRRNTVVVGLNLSNYRSNPGSGADAVTPDTENVLFSVSAGDIIKTEIIFSEEAAPTVANRNFVIFSPQISNMVSGTVVPGQTYTKEITLAEDVDVTAIGMYYRGQSADPAGIMGFELNVYKNGVRLAREETQ